LHEFNPTGAEYLLTGNSDNTNSQYRQQIVEGEVEKVKWNLNEKYRFIAGTNEGNIEWFQHSSLTSISVDIFVKIWKKTFAD
jgi:hypothetical protein